MGSVARPWDNDGKADHVHDDPLGSEALEKRLRYGDYTFDIRLLFV